MRMPHEYDHIVIGSALGGALVALQMAEKRCAGGAMEKRRRSSQPSMS